MNKTLLEDLREEQRTTIEAHVKQLYYTKSSEFAEELAKARRKFPVQNSAHEGYAVILEELEELWDLVKQKQSERDYSLLRKETIQLGAMVLAFLVEVVEPENRR